MIEQWIDLKFKLRQNYLGKIALRAGLPKAIEPTMGEKAFYNLLLDEAEKLGADLSKPNLLCDIGCRNWSYASVLERRFKNAKLLGIEVDTSRRYWNLYRRADALKSQARSLKNAAVFCDDFRALGQKEIKRLIVSEGQSQTWAFSFFFPFVSKRPCVKWGLPAEYADFESLLKHALDLSKASSAKPLIISVHQGVWEMELASASYQSCGLKIHSTLINPERFSKHWPSRHPAYVVTAV